MLSRFALRSSGARFVVVPQRNASIQEFKRRINVVKSGTRNPTKTQPNSQQQRNKKNEKKTFFSSSIFPSFLPFLNPSTLSSLSLPSLS
jgi:hypothetical protein